MCCICFFIASGAKAEADKFDQEVMCLATMMYHESRGEPESGQVAVGYTAINRSQSGCYPKSICQVVRQRAQYVGMRHEREPKHEKKVWEKIHDLATLMYVGMVKDPTRGALWFHETSISPNWAHKKNVTLTVSSHRFYRNERECKYNPPTSPIAYQLVSY